MKSETRFRNHLPYLAPVHIRNEMKRMNTVAAPRADQPTMAGWAPGSPIRHGGTGRRLRPRRQTGRNQPGWGPYVRIVIGAALIASASPVADLATSSRHQRGAGRQDLDRPGRAFRPPLPSVTNLKVCHARRRRCCDRHRRTRPSRGLAEVAAVFTVAVVRRCGLAYQVSADRPTHR